jgi:hypothetical protein
MRQQILRLDGYPRPDDARLFSPNASGGSRFDKIKRRPELAATIGALISAQHIAPMLGELVVLRPILTYPVHRDRDDDNMATGFTKLVRDCLVRARKLTDDSTEHVRQLPAVIRVERGVRRYELHMIPLEAFISELYMSARTIGNAFGLNGARDEKHALIEDAILAFAGMFDPTLAEEVLRKIEDREAFAASTGFWQPRKPPAVELTLPVEEEVVSEIVETVAERQVVNVEPEVRLGVTFDNLRLVLNPNRSIAELKLTLEHAAILTGEDRRRALERLGVVSESRPCVDCLGAADPGGCPECGGLGTVTRESNSTRVSAIRE